MRLVEGEKLPIGHGYAWTNWESMTITVLPIPFNILFRKLREYWFRLAQREEGKIDKAFHLGFKKGERVTERKMILQITRLKKEIEIWEGTMERMQKIFRRDN